MHSLKPKIVSSFTNLNSYLIDGREFCLTQYILEVKKIVVLCSMMIE